MSPQCLNGSNQQRKMDPAYTCTVSHKLHVQNLNIKRADPRVTHELFLLKLDTSKPHQSGTFVIEQLKKKSAILKKKIVLQYKNVLGLHINKTKTIFNSSQSPFNEFVEMSFSCFRQFYFLTQREYFAWAIAFALWSFSKCSHFSYISCFFSSRFLHRTT